MSQWTRPRLVFVHGVGGSRHPDDYIAEWTAALARGAVAAGHSDLAALIAARRELDIAFACYGDLFQVPVAQGETSELTEADAALVAGILYDVAEERARSVPDERGRMILADVMAGLRPPGAQQGAGDMVRRVFDAGTTLMEWAPLRRAGQWASAKLLIRDLAQVARYLNRDESLDGVSLDQRIRTRVAESLGAGPVIVVAHSLGTVVAFEALQEFAGPVPLFVTLGSPLGMRGVVRPRIRPQPPRTPEPVLRWLNFWDRDDVIAGRPWLEEDIAPNNRMVRPATSRIDSDGIWVHTATKYLAQAAVAGPVMEALASGDAGRERQAV